MFDIKCVYCKHFNPQDGCLKNLEEETCTAFENFELPIDNKDKPSCKTCAWQTNGFCDFELDNPLTCRRYKSLSEDL